MKLLKSEKNQKWNFNIPCVRWVMSFPNYIESIFLAYSENLYDQKCKCIFLPSLYAKKYVNVCGHRDQVDVAGQEGGKVQLPD